MVLRAHPRIALLLYPLPAIVMKLHGRDISYAVILIARLWCQPVDSYSKPDAQYVGMTKSWWVTKLKI